MADTEPKPGVETRGPALEGGAYEIIQNRLRRQGESLRDRLARLNQARQGVFGAIPTALIATERITTPNNCVPRDMVQVGRERFLFGYNVHIGLKSETAVSDVFAAYEHADHAFRPVALDLIADRDFEDDFKSLYKYYKNTLFVKFSVIGPHLFMVFRVGRSVTDIKTFKWLLRDGELAYQGNRSDHEFQFPPQHEFEWTRTHRDLHRTGAHPHISIEDRVFVETIGGDLTIKIEDNTDLGEGIYSEPVEHKDQTLDDAEVFYSSLGNLILLKVRPYQERAFRYFVYNEKMKQVVRIDAIADSCVLLPDQHGIIFSTGYYLQHGELKQFPTSLRDMMFDQRRPSPNGEDFLFVFYNRESGAYVLMSYNLIEQKVEQPIVCNGFSTFVNGELAYFKAEEKPRKHHVIQIWQTPYVDANTPPPEQKDSFLFKIGNPSIVRCMAECHEVLTLLRKEDTYANLYIDLVRKTGEIIDSYFWIDRPEAFELKASLSGIRDAAAGAIDEFEKVVRLKENTRKEIDRVTRSTRELVDAVDHGQFSELADFVKTLAGLRGARGEIISLKELRYADLAAVEALETEVGERSEELSRRCVEFLLRPESLQPYHDRIAARGAAVEGLKTAAEAKELEAEVQEASGELEMLIDVVSNLKIEDSTQTTRIIDGISAIYAPLNQIKAALKRKRRELQRLEGEAQFNSQTRLLDQSVLNFLEVSDTPERCDEYLTKTMMQIEELEGRFAEFDEFLVQLSEKRNELYTAFENRKLNLVEARNKKASALAAAADRILKGIQNRIQSLESVNEINGYYASDLMVDRVRTIVQELTALPDTVKADEIQGRLKSTREDAVRQLKDRLELFVDGQNVIRFGQHKFSVNTQALELTMVRRENGMFHHLAGTNYFERVSDPEFLATEPVWDQELVSENASVYRAERLAHQILMAWERGALEVDEEQFGSLSEEKQLEWVQSFMAPRYSEGYVKGLHDQDASKILAALVSLRKRMGLLRFPPRARAAGCLFWTCHRSRDPILAGKLESFRTRNELFPGKETQLVYIRELQTLVRDFLERTKLIDEDVAEQAGEYLFYDLTNNPRFVASPEAAALCSEFVRHLRQKGWTNRFEESLQAVQAHPPAVFQAIRDWMTGHATDAEGRDLGERIDEAAAILLRASDRTSPVDPRDVIDASVETRLEGMAGSHPVLESQTYPLQYHAFMEKLREFERSQVPLFQRYHALKAERVEAKRRDLRLEEFRPRVLTSFVRNQLIDSVFLPMIGDNLAKQLGVAGEATRTDRMGLLLLISPPGYGKTTLMEYIANRLGIIFMKINGPALGHQVTSLDPSEAPNASAREEVAKLNLALEMGDNVMIYLDDIQHCHPELLQKFISLCDAQRRIEGVHNGRARVYDLRGKKVAVVMAGNPYTESGAKFKIPDMLANRADTYNLGDIVAGADETFKASYIENALTSNPILSKLSSKSQKDVYAIMKIAESDSREGVSFEANYGAEEIGEMVSVMKKLFRIRDTILRVNQEYIRSAAQADEYRTEPPFRLQGSYRNMNRLAERVLPIMNDSELTALINDHYENEAQTLTTGAEANLLKFKELQNELAPEEAERWAEIKKTFRRNLLFQGAGEQDPIGRVVVHLSAFSEGLEAIRATLSEAAARKSPDADAPSDAPALSEPLLRMAEGLEAIPTALAEAISQSSQPAASVAPPPATEPKALDAIAEHLGRFGDRLDSIRALAAESLKPTSEPPSASDARIVEHLANFADRLDSIREILDEGVKRQQATLRLIDPSAPSDYQVASVTNETLQKIWALVEEDRKRAAPKPDA